MKKNKNYFLQWINERDHNPYTWRKRLNYCIKIIVIFFISLIAYNVFYTNASKLFEINLWLFNVSGILLLVSIFFIIKYGWKIITESINIFKRQKNWIRLILVVILVLGVWQIYQNKEDVLNPVLNYINKIEKNYFNPLSIKGDNFVESVAEEVDPKSTKNIQDAFEELNKFRAENSVGKIIWDDKIYELTRFQASKKLCSIKHCSHEDNEGKYFNDYASNFGINLIGFSAENIAASGCYQAVTDLWKYSTTGHRENMLNPIMNKGALAYDKGNCVLILTS
jgi:uncharacterized protein YkwD